MAMAITAIVAFATRSYWACPLFSANIWHLLGQSSDPHGSFFETGRSELLFQLLMSYVLGGRRFSLNNLWKFKPIILLAVGAANTLESLGMIRTF